MKAMYFRGLEEKNMVSVHIEAEAMAGLAMAGGISEGEKYRDDTAPKKDGLFLMMLDQYGS